MTNLGPPTPSGNRLFARYAHAPNSLGYCGPDKDAVLRAVASGRSSTDVTPIARQFSGAWPYQVTVATLAGVDDAMDVRVARAYWTGSDLTDQIDRGLFGHALLEVIRPQAGHYWNHLDESLLIEAAPTHAFHVLGVYPWSRMLDLGRPEALHVLDSCRIGWGRVIGVDGGSLIVLTRHLEYDAGVLRLGPEREQPVSWNIEGDAFIDTVPVGEHVAIHWDFACDLLTADEVDHLERWTTWQLDAMAPRLAAQYRAAGAR